MINSFWNVFEHLCNSIGKRPNPVGKDIGVASSTIAKWKSGTTPNGDTLIQIADYFNCSTDYLLGRTNNPTLNHQDNNSGNIVNGSNGDNSPLTVRNDEATEMEKEISSLLSDMSYRERTELMCLIYKFVDEHK